MKRCRMGMLLLLSVIACTPTDNSFTQAPLADTARADLWGSGEKPCIQPEAGQCPNACAGGTRSFMETCVDTGDCACPLFCAPSGTCLPYQAPYEGCTCVEEEIDEPDTFSPPPEDTTTPPLPAPDTRPPAPDTKPAPEIPPPIININDCPRPPPAGAPCNPYCQIGCNVGEQCTYTGAATFGCVENGPLSMDDLCQDFDQCEKWMGCFGVQGDTAASCHKFCIDDASCPDGRTCSVNVDFGGGVTAVVCSDAASSCNPFLASASECGVGNGCYLTSTGTKCMAAGNLGLGQDCYGQGPNTCQAGLQCLVECTNICNTNAANPLPPVCEQTCGTSFLTIDYPNSIGVCVTETVPQTCNLFTQTGCPAGEACYAVTGGWACAEEGFKEPGAACVYTNDCAAGSLCVSSVCRKACDLGLGAVAPSACASACGGTWTLLAPQAWDVGVCAVP